MKRRSEFRASPLTAAVGRRSSRTTSCLVLLLLLLASCGDDPVPKPRGYFRLDLPEEKAKAYTGNCPYSGEIPTYAEMIGGATGTSTAQDSVCWENMFFPGQHATVHMTYRRVHGDLAELINDAHAFKNKHEAKAVKIRTERLLLGGTHVYGNLFDVDGDVASPMVFYLTDSTSHFLYGALYFDARPNADSLAPVTERIREDLRRFARSLRWR